MLKKWIYDTTIILQDSVESWPQALELCAKPLLDLQVIAPEYVTAIIEQHHTLGPYYVLAPGLAMPHARPEEGAGNDSNLLIVFYVQIMPDDFVMQLHRF